jgi:hypothetical protein
LVKGLDSYSLVNIAQPTLACPNPKYNSKNGELTTVYFTGDRVALKPWFAVRTDSCGMLSVTNIELGGIFVMISFNMPMTFPADLKMTYHD